MAWLEVDEEELSLNLHNLCDGLKFVDFLNRKNNWSIGTFGKVADRGPNGPLEHLEKEAKEAREESDPEKKRFEIIDCLFLTLDAAHRHGMTFADILDCCEKKLETNKKRKWVKVEGKGAIEHDRSLDT